MITNNLKKKLKNKRIGLALGGGGARGLSHIKFLDVFDQLGIKPSIISGTSIGALIGALYSSGLNAKEIEDEFREINLLEAGSLIDINLKNTYGMIKGNKIEKLLKKKTENMNFSDLLIPFIVVASDFWEGKEISINKGPVYKAVRASISIPGIFEPLEYNDRILIDGGNVNPVPYDIIADKCDVTIAVDAVGSRLSGADFGKKPNIFECIISAYQISQEIIVKSKMSISKPDIYIKPLLKNLNVLEFHRIDYILSEAEKDSLILKKILSKMF